MIILFSIQLKNNEDLVFSGGMLEIHQIDNLRVERDCNGDLGAPFGDPFLDDCDVCSEGNTGHEYNSDLDCTDTCFGGAYIDDCGVCSGGKTGILPNADKDCEDVCFGTAYLDDCDVCSEGNTGHIPNEDMDCNGDCFGTAAVKITFIYFYQ